MKHFKKWVLCVTLLASLLPGQIAGAAEQNETSQIKAGRNFSIVKQSDGTVLTWGENSNGQLGNGTTESIMQPALVSNLSGIVAVEAGEYHSLALKNDGTVWAWGANGNGQIGDGTAIDRLKPVQVKKLDHVVAIGAGGSQSFAIKDNGTLWAWGKNGYGQLGDGTTADRAQPTEIKGVNQVKAVASGLNHTIIMKNDGTVWAWGSNSDGQIGNGTWHSTKAPVQVKGINQVIAIAAGGGHSLALKSDGTVWVWGRNADGQLADGAAEVQNHPIRVEEVTEVVHIGAGRDFCLAINRDGSVWAWGSNYRGQLGLGTDRIRQQRSAILADITDVVALDGGELHAVALKKDGSVWGMGQNGDGQLGNGGGKETYGPIQVNDLNVSMPQLPTSPTPTTPSNGQGNVFTVKGDQGAVRVQGAKPGALITLLKRDEMLKSNFGTKVADSNGSVVFNKIPSGTGYGVFEMENGQVTRTIVDVAVTEEKTAVLLKDIRAQIVYLGDRQKENIPSTINLELNGTLAEGEYADQLKKVDVEFGGISVSVPVRNRNFTLSQQYMIYSPMDVVTVTAVTPDGKQRHVIHRTVGRDLFNDGSVKAERAGDSWIITANKGFAPESGYKVYLIDGHNKLIPLSAPEKSKLSKEQLERLALVSANYKGVITTDKAKQDITLFVEAESFVEIVSIMP
ncbi:RCC1 domain-containing protein [Brevibacillus sp. SYSU BS000544]|uniref:RCC1 domain-containing protein n=1 Tax=Brevibacillus sp. SYSU BS000544 TaxID=3416443 RepID=UPI003CE5797D